jgi:hypothetical protein
MGRTCRYKPGDLMGWFVMELQPGILASRCVYRYKKNEIRCCLSLTAIGSLFVVKAFRDRTRTFGDYIQHRNQLAICFHQT